MIRLWISMRTICILISILSATIDARKVRFKSAISTEEPQAHNTPRQVIFYAEEPQQSEEDAPVLIARQPSYGRASSSQQTLSSRSRTETSKAPPVQTIRNYNKINDDGSFTFGYEAADGSFKEETRGTDCVVRGKYGYIDPDGNKREFTYVSGNPCDPNAINQEEEDELADKSGENENIPINIPSRRPNLVVKPVKSRPTTTLFQQSFNNDDSGQEEDNNQLVEIKQPVRPLLRPSFKEEEQAILRSTIRPTTKNTYPTTRYISKQNSVDNQPATTYRPQIVQIAVTPSPVTLVPKTTNRDPFIPSTASTPSFFDDQFKKFQLESNVIPSQGSVSKPLGSNPLYSTELIYDPTSGQYNTIVYQQVPKFGSEISLNQKLPFVPSPQPTLQPVATSRFLTTTTQSPFFQQQYIQQQQQAALVQQSQQLYNQQLRHQQLQQQQQQRQFPPQSLTQNTLLKQNPHRFPQPIVQRFPPDIKQIRQETFQQPPPPPPPIYYYNPAVADERQNIASGQIEAFLRGHNLQF